MSPHPYPCEASDEHWCTCGPVPMWSCDECHEFKVPAKKKGIGYVCDDCMEDWQQ